MGWMATEKREFPARLPHSLNREPLKGDDQCTCSNPAWEALSVREQKVLPVQLLAMCQQGDTPPPPVYKKLQLSGKTLTFLNYLGPDQTLRQFLGLLLTILDYLCEPGHSCHLLYN